MDKAGRRIDFARPRLSRTAGAWALSACMLLSGCAGPSMRVSPRPRVDVRPAVDPTAASRLPRAIDSLGAWTLQQAGALLVVDVRPRRGRPVGTLPAGAVWLPLEPGPDASAAFIDAVLDAVDGDQARPIGLICERGVMSRRAQALLRAAGFTATVDVEDGISGSVVGPGWSAWGLPMADDR